MYKVRGRATATQVGANKKGNSVRCDGKVEEATNRKKQSPLNKNERREVVTQSSVVA